ncbi:MAG: glucosylceramidase [Fibrobacter sp.]|nr:glucosylceramidase [Fibrobacter sp.]
MLSKYLQNNTHKGTVNKLMTPGLAVEFIQPWYTPLSTTPSTTGMPVGGIGSTFTVTPAGTTPVLNFLPGIQVQGTEEYPLRLNNFFFAESLNGAPLEVFNYDAWQRKISFYPLQNSAGAPLFAELPAEANPQEFYAEALNSVVSDAKIWEANQEALHRWQIEFSPRTQKFITAGDTSSVAFNRAWLVDFFDGAVGLATVARGALTGAWDGQNEIWGEKCYPAEQMEYQALYPVSETKFNGEQKVAISQYKYSSIMPHDERLSSLPLNHTVFTLHNPSSETRQLTLVQMQDNMCGYQVLKDRQGVQDASFNLQPAAKFPQGEIFSANLGSSTAQGVVFSGNKASDFDGSMAIAAMCEGDSNITVKPHFYQDHNPVVVAGALSSGRLNGSFMRNVYSGRETTAGAVCVNVVLEPGQSVEVVFSMVLDFPTISMPGVESVKKYVKFYPESEGRAVSMLTDYLKGEKTLRGEILEKFQAMLNAENVKALYPQADAEYEKFRTLSYNTLGFLAEATVWDIEDRFLVRECADYPFFNSLDVYFYGSFSLLALLPQLDGAVMRSFSDAVLATDSAVRRHHEYVNHPHADLPSPKLEGVRAVRGAVIHDLGSPFDARPDAYDWHNVKSWKDLAPKFVMMVWRHFRLTGDRGILDYCREAVYASMQYLEAMVEPGQEFPLTQGTDDTFDNLSSHGISVYCGSFWVGGLRAAAAVAQEFDDVAQAQRWNDWADRAQEQFHTALWDEKEEYFHFFITPVQVGDLKADKLAELAAVPALAGKTDNVLSATNALNDYLNEYDYSSEVSRREQRRAKKHALLKDAPQAFNQSFVDKIDLDSDDVFADSMLADTYVRMLGLAPLTTDEKAQQTLRKVFATNYKANSPHIGAANMVHADGMPLDEFNFQAHDVWIGVQYSLVTALSLHKMYDEARDIIASMVRNLYQEARIPFAAPEGFNGSSKLHSAPAAQALNLSSDQGEKLISSLKSAAALLPDNRVSPQIPHSIEEFGAQYAAIISEFGVEAEALFRLLHSTALKYTAGRYLRPGMVWAISSGCAGALLRCTAIK